MFVHDAHGGAHSQNRYDLSPALPTDYRPLGAKYIHWKNRMNIENACAILEAGLNCIGKHTFAW